MRTSTHIFHPSSCDSSVQSKLAAGHGSQQAAFFGAITINASHPRLHLRSGAVKRDVESDGSWLNVQVTRSPESPDERAGVTKRYLGQSSGHALDGTPSGIRLITASA